MANRSKRCVGVDIGGSGMKASRVDVTTGRLLGARHRISTPCPATPAAMLDVLGELASLSEWQGPVGCTFPAVIQNGVARSATNLDASWAGVNVRDVVSERLQCRAVRP